MLAEARYKDTLARGAELSTSELLERFRTTDMFWRQREVGELLVPRRDPAIERALVPMLTFVPVALMAAVVRIFPDMTGPRMFIWLVS